MGETAWDAARIEEDDLRREIAGRLRQGRATSEALRQYVWSQRSRPADEVDMPAIEKIEKQLAEWEPLLIDPKAPKLSKEMLEDHASTQALQGFEAGEGLRDFAGKYTGRITPKQRADYRALHLIWRTKKPLHDLAKTFVSMKSREAGGGEVGWSMNEDLSKIPEEDRGLFLSFVHKHAFAHDRTRAEKADAAYWRGHISPVVNFAHAVRVAPSLVGLKKEWAEEVSFIEQAHRIRQSEDPIEADGFVESGIYNLIQMAPSMAVGGGLGGKAAMAFWTFQIAPGRRQEYIEDGMDPTVATWAGFASGLIEAKIEMWGQQAPKALPGGWKRLVKRRVWEAFKEVGEEPQQEQVGMLVERAFGAVFSTPELKEALTARTGWDELKRDWEAAKEAIVPMGIIGFGGAMAELTQRPPKPTGPRAGGISLEEGKRPEGFPPVEPKPGEEPTAPEVTPEEVEEQQLASEAEALTEEAGGGVPRAAVAEPEVEPTPEAPEVPTPEAAVAEEPVEAPPAEVEVAPEAIAPAEAIPEEGAPPRFEAQAEEKLPEIPRTLPTAEQEAEIGKRLNALSQKIAMEPREAPSEAETGWLLALTQAESDHRADAKRLSAALAETVAPREVPPAEAPVETPTVDEEAAKQARIQAEMERVEQLKEDDPFAYKALQDKFSPGRAGAQAFRTIAQAREAQGLLKEAEVAGVEPRPFGELKPAEERALVSTHSYEQAKKRIAGRRGQVMAGIDPGMLRDWATIGAYHVESGVRKFAAWSKQMIAELGDAVRPHLRKLWADLKPVVQELDKVEKQIARDVKEADRPSAVRARLQRDFMWHRGEMVSLRAGDVLKLALTREARGARKGYRAGQIDQQATQQEIADYIAEKLEPEDQDLANRALQRAIKARTPAQRRNVIKAINLMAQKREVATAANEAKAALKDARGRVQRPELQQQLEAIEDSIALSKPTAKTLAHAESLIAATEQDDIGEIPQRLIDKARKALSFPDRKYIRDLSPSEIRGITDAVQMLAKINNMKDQMLFSAKTRSRTEVLNEAIRDIQNRHGQPYAELAERRGETQRLSPASEFASWDHLSLETDAFLLGGDKSVVYDVFYRGLRKGDAEAQSVIDQASKAIAEAEADAEITETDKRRWSEAIVPQGEGIVKRAYNWLRGRKQGEVVSVALPTARDEDGKRVPTLAWTRGEMAAFLANWDDSETRQQILRDKGKGIILAVGKGLAVKLKRGDVQAILEAAEGEGIIAVKDAMVAYVNGPLKDQMNAAWLDEYGVEVAKRDDYWPRRRDAEFRAREPGDVMQHWATVYPEDQGIFKSRTGSAAPVIIGDLYQEFYDHVRKVAAFIGRSRAAKDARRLLNQRGFRRSVRGAFKNGETLLKEMDEAVRDYGSVESARLSALEKTVQQLTRKGHVAVLALKGRVLFYQLVSLLNANIEVAGRHLFNPKNLTRKKADTQAEINQYSPLLSARTRGNMHNLLTAGSAGSGIAAFYGVKGGSLGQLGMDLIHKQDSWVIRGIWNGWKATLEAQGLTGDELMQRTAQETLETVDRTQPTYDNVTISALQRRAKKSPLMKLLVFCGSQRNKNTNTVVREASRYKHIPAGEATAADHSRFVKGIAMPTIVAATMIHALQLTGRWMVGGGYKEDESWWEHISKVIDRLLGGWLVLGDVASLGKNAIAAGLGKQSSYFLSPRRNIVMSTIEDTAKAGYHAVKAVQEAATDSRETIVQRAGRPKATASAVKAAQRGSRALGVYLGIPTQAAEELFRPWMQDRPSSEEQEFTKMRGEASRAYTQEKIHAEEEGRDPSPELVERYQWFSRHGRLIAAIRKAGREESPEVQNDYERYIEGVRRHAVGAERSTEFPNPLTADGVPQKIIDIAWKYHDLLQNVPAEIRDRRPLERAVRR